MNDTDSLLDAALYNTLAALTLPTVKGAPRPQGDEGEPAREGAASEHHDPPLAPLESDSGK